MRHNVSTFNISELIRLRYKIYLYDYIYFKIIILWRKNELYNSYFISALFHLIFSVQKLVLPNSYFTYSDPFIRNESISLKKYFYRIVVVIFFNVFFYLLLNLFYTSGEITTMLLSSNFLGVFLILWPLIFKPSQNLERNLSKNLLLYYIVCILLFNFNISDIYTYN